jgi:transposase-like protein
MTEDRSPPPEAEACLCRPYPSSQKGGTLICAEVDDLATHERWLASGRYRPSGCARCGAFLHIHDYRRRVTRGGGGLETTTEVARFRCSRCGATWQVLPRWLARHLWRAWSTVERVVIDHEAARDSPPIPERTVVRWLGRLASSAALLVTVLAASGSEELGEVAKAVGREGTRSELVAEYTERIGGMRRGERLAAVAEHAHRLVRGVRLM